MFELALSIFCTYRNAQLAKQKGQNSVLWGVMTFVAFFVASAVGGALLIMTMNKGALNQAELMAFVINRPVLLVTITFLGLGGYLLLRYRLEKMPDTKKEAK